MKRLCFAFLLIVIMLISCAPARVEQQQDKAESSPALVYEDVLGLKPNIKFGMAENEVRDSETYPISEEYKGEISFYVPQEKQLSGFNDMFISYVFNSKNQMCVLTYGLYSSDKSVFTLDTHGKLLELISSVEGEPSDVKKFWSDTYYENQPANWEKAFNMGHYKNTVYWENEEYKIIFNFSNSNGTIQYQSKTISID